MHISTWVSLKNPSEINVCLWMGDFHNIGLLELVIWNSKGYKNKGYKKPWWKKFPINCNEWRSAKNLEVRRALLFTLHFEINIIIKRIHHFSSESIPIVDLTWFYELNLLLSYCSYERIESKLWSGRFLSFFILLRRYVINDKNIKPHKMYRKKLKHHMFLRWISVPHVFLDIP